MTEEEDFTQYFQINTCNGEYIPIRVYYLIWVDALEIHIREQILISILNSESADLKFIL